MAAILADNIYKCIFLNENDKIVIQISLKLVSRSPVNNNPALVLILAWSRTGEKPLPEPMMIQFSDIYVALGGEELWDDFFLKTHVLENIYLHLMPVLNIDPIQVVDMYTFSSRMRNSLSYRMIQSLSWLLNSLSYRHNPFHGCWEPNTEYIPHFFGNQWFEFCGFNFETFLFLGNMKKEPVMIF